MQYRTLVQIGRRIYELKEREEFFIEKGQEKKSIDFLTKNFRLAILKYPMEDGE